MKARLVSLLFLFSVFGFSQTEILEKTENAKPDSVTFIATVKTSEVTKDGIWLKGYVVNIDSNELQKINGKQIEVSGLVTVQKGVKPQVDENGNDITPQGRGGDTKHIEKPSYRVIEKP